LFKGVNPPKKFPPFVAYVIISRMKDYDLIIIGGGVVGVAIARQLSRYRIRIAILEKEAELSFGVSKSNSGIIHPGTQIAPGLLKGRLCVQGNLLMRKIARELGVDFKEVGELIVAFDEMEALRLKQIKSDAEKLGVPDLTIVDQAWLEKNEPNLSRKVFCALYAPSAGIISPYRLVYDMAENAASNGVQTHLNTKVTSILRIGRAQAGCWRLTTSSGDFAAKFIVNAAGLFADEISGMVGVRDFKIVPRKGEEFILDKKLKFLTNHLIFPIPARSSKGILMIKTADGNPMIGPNAHETSDKEDLSTTQTSLDEVLAAAKRLVPAVNGDDIIAYFAGLRPIAGEDFIIRREEAAPSFINVAGIQSPGLTASPAIAVMVEGLLRDCGLVLRLKLLFKRQRKASVHLFAVPLAKTKALIIKDAAYGDIVCRCEMVSAKEVRESIARGATTMDGIKFRTRAQGGRCHGSFCTTRLMKILAQETGKPITEITKRGKGSEIVKGQRETDHRPETIDQRPMTYG